MEPFLSLRAVGLLTGLYVLLAVLIFSPNSPVPPDIKGTLLAGFQTVVRSCKIDSQWLLRTVTLIPSHITLVGACRCINRALLAIQVVILTTWTKSVDLHQDLSNAEAVGYSLATLWVFGLVLILGQAIGLTAGAIIRAVRYMVCRIGWILCILVKELVVNRVHREPWQKGQIWTFGVLLAAGVGYGVAR